MSELRTQRREIPDKPGDLHLSDLRAHLEPTRRRVGACMMPTGTFWNHCPFCGVEALQGTVEDTYADVPLGAEGPPPPAERQLIGSEVTYIQCQGCSEEVHPHHYYGHGGGDCDCTIEDGVNLEGPNAHT